jgi:3-oxoacyl-[acyl-carrier-protein] synthase-3
VRLGFEKLTQVIREKGIDPSSISYFLPHMSSYFFKDKIAESLIDNGIPIPDENWFTNLKTVGNVGAGSIYLMVDELFNSGKLKVGDKVLLAVPESSRFSYVFSLLTVC